MNIRVALVFIFILAAFLYVISSIFLLDDAEIFIMGNCLCDLAESYHVTIS